MAQGTSTEETKEDNSSGNMEKKYFFERMKKQRKKTALAIEVPVAQGLQLAKANKILRDVDRDSKFKLKVSGLINDWAQSQIDK